MSLVSSSEETLPVKEVKRKVAYQAAELVENGMLVGLGTGSTAMFMIERLIQRQQEEDLAFTAVATSRASDEQARAGGISMVDINNVHSIDLTIDGADELDPQLRMVKGGGGALLREKLIASASKEMVVIIDETKLVDKLGAFGLPVEVIPFGYGLTLKRLEALGYQPVLRLAPDGKPFVTDNQNYIVDVRFVKLCDDPETDDAKIREIVGVVETGFFFGIAKRALVGFQDGRVEIRE